ncbi:hypothetical protein II1_01167 [Bacillus cereus MC118]|uniref:Uncharacterized protein n=1 Tax=Bacillus cereus MC67 TaxID=1053219 RepID=J8F588_BACCE|nr:hypothetical protein II3_04511 [Bacillus cereus MC67]EOP18701.1 hypothetical protein II1_01167 [Bacillus cereus MC118]
MTVKASFDDGSFKDAEKNNAKITDRVNVTVSSRGPITTGYSGHEWVMKGDSAYTSKEMVIRH